MSSHFGVHRTEELVIKSEKYGDFDTVEVSSRDDKKTRHWVSHYISTEVQEIPKELFWDMADPYIFNLTRSDIREICKCVERLNNEPAHEIRSTITWAMRRGDFAWVYYGSVLHVFYLDGTWILKGEYHLDDDPSEILT